MIRSLSNIEKIKSEGYFAIAEESNRIKNRAPIIENSLGYDWKYVSQGRHRRVFRRGNVVIKIPTNLSGLEANIMEREIFLSRREEGIFAPCRLLSNGCLMMRALTDIYGRTKLHPAWAYYLDDGPQIGIDSNGKIMVYDYSEEF